MKRFLHNFIDSLIVITYLFANGHVVLGIVCVVGTVLLLCAIHAAHKTWMEIP